MEKEEKTNKHTKNEQWKILFIVTLGIQNICTRGIP